MKSLRGRFFIANRPKAFREVNLGYNDVSPAGKAYYILDRTQLKEKIISSGVYTRKQIEIIEKEGCKIVVGNSLTVSPFSGFRHFISIKYPEKIMKGLKIIIEAVASDAAMIITPKNFPEITKAFEKYVMKSPNISMHLINDNYPLGFEEVIIEKIFKFDEPGGYFPGKEGNLVTSVEDLLRIYLQVEEHENNAFHPLMVITEKENIFTWANKEYGISDLMRDIGVCLEGFVIKGDLLWGQVVLEPEREKIGNSNQIFIIPDNSIVLNRCINCGRCCEVCMAKLKYPHSMTSLKNRTGIIPFRKVAGCVGCGLCGFYCPAWKT